MSGIQGKVILITGASSGIGESTARVLAGKGARVVLVRAALIVWRNSCGRFGTRVMRPISGRSMLRASKTFKRSQASRWKRTGVSMLLSTMLA